MKFGISKQTRKALLPHSRRDGHHCYAFHRLNAKVTEWHASECNIHEVNLCKTKRKKEKGKQGLKKQNARSHHYALDHIRRLGFR